jgi:hypothetical protein
MRCKLVLINRALEARKVLHTRKPRVKSSPKPMGSRVNMSAPPSWNSMLFDEHLKNKDLETRTCPVRLVPQVDHNTIRDLRPQDKAKKFFHMFGYPPWEYKDLPSWGTGLEWTRLIQEYYFGHSTIKDYNGKTPRDIVWGDEI